MVSTFQTDMIMENLALAQVQFARIECKVSFGHISLQRSEMTSDTDFQIKIILAI